MINPFLRVSILVVGVIKCAAQTTYIADSIAQADVNAKVALAVAGDTVLIPSGTNIWTGLTLLDKAITLDAQSGSTNEPNATMLIWQRTAANLPIIKITAAARVLHLKFSGTHQTIPPQSGIIQIATSTYTPWRVGYCNFYDWCLAGKSGRAIYKYNFPDGLIDHCEFNPVTDGVAQAITLDGESQSIPTWNGPPSWGTITNVYIEDCAFPYHHPNDAGVEFYQGIRGVVRHCTFGNVGSGMHGLDSQNLVARGTYSREWYNNTHLINSGTGYTIPARIWENRGGSELVFSNTVTAPSSFLNYQIKLNIYRSTRDFYYLSPDKLSIQGGDKWFKRSPSSSPNLQNNTGFHTGADGASVLEDSTKAWPVNQWTDPSDGRVWNVGDNSTGSVTANSATTATATLAGGTRNNWNTGDPYMIISGGDPADGSTYYDLNFPVWFIHGASTGSGSTLTDSSASWTNNALVGLKVWNLTDNSKGPITANTATTITATLSGGAANTWSIGHEYVVTDASGTHTGASGATVLEDTNQNWAVNKWVDVYLWNRTTAARARVASNTSNTVSTIFGMLGAGTRRTWNPGDEYVLTQGIPSVDGVGRVGPTKWYGPGETVVSDWTSANVTHQYTHWAPCYEWENYVNGTTNINFSISAAVDTGVSPNITNFIYFGFSHFNNTVKPGYTPLTYPHPSISSTPPGAITAINPTNNATGVSPSFVQLSWSCTGATGFDVYFGTEAPPVSLIADDIPGSTFDLFPLANDTTYFWTIIASNVTGSSTNTFNFRTAALEPPPPPGASGNQPANSRRRNL